MADVLLGAQLVGLIAMVGVSAWGWRNMDPEHRVRARAGLTGIDWTWSKKAALVTTPLLGLLVFLATLAVRDSPNREAISALGLVAMVTFLLAHLSSVRRGAR